MTKKEILKLVTTEYDGLNKVGNKYKNDYEIVKQAVKYWPYQIKYASSYLKANKELGLIAVKEDGLLISELEYNLRNDPDIILEALKQDGTAIQYLKYADVANKEYIDIAIKSNPFAIYHINKELITLEQAKHCLSLEPTLFCHLNDKLRRNPELINLANDIDSKIYLNADDEIIFAEYEDPFASFGDEYVSISEEDLPF